MTDSLIMRHLNVWRERKCSHHRPHPNTPATPSPLTSQEANTSLSTITQCLLLPLVPVAGPTERTARPPAVEGDLTLLSILLQTVCLYHPATTMAGATYSGSAVVK